MGVLESVNVGVPRTVTSGGREITTAIWKDPVAGPVAVRGVNLAGDDQADRTVHGGPDKAVYAYAAEDTAWWEAELGRPLGPGAFGENLTVRGLDVTGAVIGERWAVGSTRLEVRQPREPCFKLALKMGDGGFSRRFTAAGRPGAYLGIVAEGSVAAGDEVAVVERPDHGVTVGALTRARDLTADELAAVLDVPALPAGWREWVIGRLDRLA